MSGSVSTAKSHQKFKSLTDKELLDMFEDDQKVSKKVKNIDNICLMRRNSIRKVVKRIKFERENDDNFRDFIEIISRNYVKINAGIMGKRVNEEDVAVEMKRISSLLRPENLEKKSGQNPSFSLYSSPRSPAPMSSRIWNCSKK